MSGPHLTYGTLVKDEGDMVGHVAYALYKRDKLSFIQAIRRRPHSKHVRARAGTMGTIFHVALLWTRYSSKGWRSMP